MVSSLIMFKKVIIWGYPLYSHTHSFIHAGWFKAFKSLNYETYWFDNENYPIDFDFTNCLFISEGFADNNIPINNKSIYIIHICKEPKKYLEKGARLIDLRHNLKFIQDFSYDYVMKKEILEKIDEVSYYEKNASDLALRQKFRNNISGYEALYISWATDLLPDEILYKNIFIPKENNIYYIGSYWSANYKEINQFKTICSNNNINFIIRDPWKEKTTFEENKKLIQISYMAPDIRGSGVTCHESDEEKCNHLSTGFIPCRIFKNISYGQLGITNSETVNNLFEQKLIYNKNLEDLFYNAKKQLKNFSLIKEQMNFVKERHTYINRINSILTII